MKRLAPRLAAVLLALGVAAGLWLALAPVSLGGGASYVIVTGSSMEPGLRDGDLVLLRPATTYAVGDVVGYRDAGLRRVVLHRIVARDGGRFVTEGDANGFRDPTRPRPADIVGREWASVPRVGAALGWARNPLPAAILVGGLALLPVGTRLRRRRRGAPASRVSARPAPRNGRRDVVLGLAAAALALGAVGAYAAVRPATRSVSVEGAYRQSGQFTYSATAPRGATYPDGLVRSGEAVFPALSRSVRVRFDYRLASGSRERVSGRIGLDAVVGDGLGWTRTLTLAPSRPFDGPSAAVSGTLRLDRLRALLRDFERESQTSSSAYTVRLAPRVTVAGEVGGARVEDRFAPALDLRLDESRLVPAPSDEGRPPALRASRPGAITLSEPARIGAWGAAVSVPLARMVGLLGAEALLALVIVLGLPLHRLSRRSPADRILVRYGDRLVEVSRLPRVPSDRVVEVERIEDLVRLAENLGEPLMVADDGAVVRFGVVSGGDLLYRHTAHGAHPAAARVVA